MLVLLPLALLPSAALFQLPARAPPQRGHRVRAEDLEDLPLSWARQAKLAQLEATVPAKHERLHVATFAAGCYWGAELRYQRQPGVVATCVGFTGYETGGANEAVQLIYDPDETTYEELLDVLWDSIDPTLRNRVGSDHGKIYRHAVYTHDAEQHASALKSLAQQQRATNATVWTEVLPASLFYVAQPRHQRYLERGMKGTPQRASKGCTEPIRCYGGVRTAPPPTMQLGTGFEFVDEERSTMLVSMQKPLGLVIEEEALDGESSESALSGRCVVAAVMNDSAASRAGIEVGFRLLAVNNYDVQAAELEEVMELLVQGPRVVNLRFLTTRR